MNLTHQLYQVSTVHTAGKKKRAKKVAFNFIKGKDPHISFLFMREKEIRQ